MKVNGNEYTNEDIKRFWANGDLSYLLYDYQLPLYEAIWKIIKGKAWFGVINVARQWGKTFVTTLIFCELALRNKRYELHFVAENRAYLKNRVYKCLDIIMDTCPYPNGGNVRPWTKGSGKEQGTDAMIFPLTGSKIYFFGYVEDGYRGGSANAVNVDEAAFIKDLKHLVVSEIEPSFNQTKGKCILTSTPGDTDDHYYNEMVREAKEMQTFITFTAYDNANIDAAELANKRRRATGADGTLTPEFRREYLAELIPNATLLIIPAWTDERDIVLEELMQALRSSPYYKVAHKFISIDYGVKDFTVISYYFYDHWSANKRLIKEWSTWMKGEKVSIGLIAKDVKANKIRLWQMTDLQYPTLVICDSADPLANQTLQQDHHIPAIGVKKERMKSTMVSKFNDLVAEGGFGCYEGLKNDIGCYRSGIWDKDFRGIKYARSPTYGHYDCIDGDVYLNLMASGFYAQTPIAPIEIDLRTQHGPPELVNSALRDKIGGPQRFDPWQPIETKINNCW